MIEPAATYEDVRDGFRWRLPQRYNIGVDVVDKWADGDRLALIHKRSDGGVERHSFRDIRRLSNRLANALAARGVGAGDRVAILLGQRPETAIAHVGAFKLGAGFQVRTFSQETISGQTRA